MKKLLETKNLSLTRNDYCIFSDINLDIQEGQLINIYGKNGAGKTSLLKILAGITEHTDGEIIYHNDLDVSTSWRPTT
ncbi:MAG: ATP-binding cassette domain-containing protein, partial [Pelagibacterales bacterium]|nr:ATP-binding cassette domain-containing protein [Pelagibacterales bacterium]